MYGLFETVFVLLKTAFTMVFLQSFKACKRSELDNLKEEKNLLVCFPCVSLIYPCLRPAPAPRPPAMFQHSDYTGRVFEQQHSSHRGA